MQKIITVLFSFILVCSISACSDSPEELYGFYKNANEKKLDQSARTETLVITKDTIKISSWDFTNKILKMDKEKDTWILETKDGFGKHIEKLKIIDDNTIEYMSKNKKSVRKFIKITEEEYNYILKHPKLLPEPPLF